MKKVIIALTVLIIVAGCGGGGDDAVPPQLTPRIDNAVTTDGASKPKYLFEVGDLFNIIVYATDNNLDMDGMVITIYRPMTASTPLFDTYFELPEQTAPSMKYFFIQDAVATGDDVGTWKLEFQITDKLGNESNVYILNFEVLPIPIQDIPDAPELNPQSLDTSIGRSITDSIQDAK